MNKLIFLVLFLMRLVPGFLKLQFFGGQILFTNLRSLFEFYFNFYSFTNLFIVNRLNLQINFLDVFLIPMGVWYLFLRKIKYRLFLLLSMFLLPLLSTIRGQWLHLIYIFSAITLFAILSYLGILNIINIVSKYNLKTKILLGLLLIIMYLYFYLYNLDFYLFHNL